VEGRWRGRQRRRPNRTHDLRFRNPPRKSNRATAVRLISRRSSSRVSKRAPPRSGLEGPQSPNCGYNQRPAHPRLLPDSAQTQPGRSANFPFPRSRSFRPSRCRRPSRRSSPAHKQVARWPALGSLISLRQEDPTAPRETFRVPSSVRQQAPRAQTVELIEADNLKHGDASPLSPSLFLFWAQRLIGLHAAPVGDGGKLRPRSQSWPPPLRAVRETCRTGTRKLRSRVVLRIWAPPMPEVKSSAWQQNWPPARKELHIRQPGTANSGPHPRIEKIGRIEATQRTNAAVVNQTEPRWGAQGVSARLGSYSLGCSCGHCRAFERWPRPCSRRSESVPPDSPAPGRRPDSPRKKQSGGFTAWNRKLTASPKPRRAGAPLRRPIRDRSKRAGPIPCLYCFRS